MGSSTKSGRLDSAALELVKAYDATMTPDRLPNARRIRRGRLAWEDGLEPSVGNESLSPEGDVVFEFIYKNLLSFLPASTPD
jgi:hypothetical protein